MRPELLLFDFKDKPIFEQLRLEEALLRGSSCNACIINCGSPRAIVLGISGKPELMLHVEKVKRDRIPVIQRFSGGGTVIVDENTLFITFIFSKNAIPIHPFPEPILRWSGDVYTQAWKIPHFHLIENDYAIGSLKCGGNAQYIQKERWLHHTSFLWDFSQENMDYLRLPSKRPKYRENRSHAEFLCRLRDYAPSKQTLITSLIETLSKSFTLIPGQVEKLTFGLHRQSLRWIENL